VVSPFTDAPEITYTLPWSSSSTHNPLVYQFAPDQSLIFLGTPYGLLSNTPASLADTPALRDDDQPVFRLTPGGGARLVGLFDFDMSTIPASSDGHYLLLEAVDHTSFFVYDVFEDRPLAEMPAFPELDYFWATAAFYENGLIVHLTAATPDSTYREFYLAHSFLTGNSASWDDESWLFESCMDMLTDDSLVCWAYDDSQSFSLVRYNPWTKESTILLENGVIITAIE
jgi:hypothetical protein